MHPRKYAPIIIVGACASAIGFITMMAEYCDLPGFDHKAEIGRTKNSIAAVVAGVVGQKMHGYSDIDLQIKKQVWPDARVTGNTTPYSVDTYVDLAFTSERFTAHNDGIGRLSGNVEKSEFDWKVEQTQVGKYQIGRWGPKFDSELEISVNDGRVFGRYIRNGPHFNWNINGTYDAQGNVKVEIDGPLNLGIVLNGKILKK